jgi:hypothetical protein
MDLYCVTAVCQVIHCGKKKKKERKKERKKKALCYIGINVLINEIKRIKEKFCQIFRSTHG